MPILPFICLSIGILLGIFIKNKYFIIYSGKLSTIALSLLMLSIGLGIGIDNSIMENFLKIGFNCIIISLSAIIFSVIFTIICEKTVLPLKQLDEELEKKILLSLLIQLKTKKKQMKYQIVILNLFGLCLEV